MLSQPSQLLTRNLHLFDEGDWLVVNPADASIPQEIDNSSVDFLHQYFDVFSQCTQLKELSLDSRDVCANPNGFVFENPMGLHTHYFCPFMPNDKVYTDILIYMPKAKAQLSLLLAMCMPSLSLDGRIYLVGENKGGIKSAPKILAQFGDVQKVDSARHCSLIACHATEPVKRFQPNQWLDVNEYEANDIKWRVASLPGVFSHGELDDATHLLLTKITDPLRGSLLDFACGSGVIGSYLNKKYPHIDISMSDISALSLYCSAVTVSENSQVANLIAANGLTGIEKKFKQIVTNPPFHTGIKTDYSITEGFIYNASSNLEPNGALYLVANRFLPYHGLLAERFSPVNILAQSTKFTVYHAGI